MNKYSYRDIYLLNTILPLLLFIGLFFVPYGKINIPTSTTYEYIKIEDSILTFPLSIGLIILNLINLFTFDSLKIRNRTTMWLIWLTIVLFILCLLQIHLEENGHAGNLIIRPNFSLYNFQTGFLLMIGAVCLFIINIFIAKKRQLSNKT